MNGQNDKYAFLRGIKNEELSRLIKDKDPRILEILADPKLKRQLYDGTLTREAEKPVEQPKPEGAKETPEKPVEVQTQADPQKPAEGEDPYKKRGFKSPEGLLKTFDNQSEYIKRLEKQRDEINARQGAEGGPLGLKVKELNEKIEMLSRQNEDLLRKTSQPQQHMPSNRDIVSDALLPNFPDLDPALFTDGELARKINAQNAEYKRAISVLMKRANTMDTTAFQRKFDEQDSKYRKLEEMYKTLQDREEIRERQAQTERSENSLNSVYQEADRFVRNTLKVSPTRTFADIDKDIAYHRATDSDGGQAYEASLPEIDREAWQQTIALIGKYGSLVKGQGFVKYPNVDSLDELYILELHKSGRLEKDLQRRILDAQRNGARSVIDAQNKIGASAQGIDPDKLKGEELPLDKSIEDKQKRLKELNAMGAEILKNKALYDEQKSLTREIRDMWKMQLAKR